MDYSNGYEGNAQEFIYGRCRSLIGEQVVKNWARSLKPDSLVFDIGCGNGVIVTQALLATGHTVFAIDASATMIRALQNRFPQVTAKCEAIQNTNFFDKQYDAVIASGVLFLLSEMDQLAMISRVAEILNPTGRFLFTAPIQICRWNDIITGQQSRSLGRERYEEALIAAGLSLLGTYTDEGDNNYFDFEKR